jgi:hypothetical protein
MRVSDEHFDRHQFEKPTHAVSATRGIGFSDLAAMQLTEHGGTTHKARRCKRWVPPWSASPEKVKRIVAYMLYRNASEGRGEFPEAEFQADNLGFIWKYEAKCREDAARMRLNLDVIGDEAKRAKARERAVCALGFGKVLLSVIFKCYNEGYTSAECSQSLSVPLSPQGVRMYLARANCVARLLYPADCLPFHHSTNPEMYFAPGKRSRSLTRRPRVKPGEGRTNTLPPGSKGRRKPPYRIAEFEAFGLAKEHGYREAAATLNTTMPMIAMLCARHRQRPRD